jgi:hypothetical protein
MHTSRGLFGAVGQRVDALVRFGHDAPSVYDGKDPGLAHSSCASHDESVHGAAAIRLPRTADSLPRIEAIGAPFARKSSAAGDEIAARGPTSLTA